MISVLPAVNAYRKMAHFAQSAARKRYSSRYNITKPSKVVATFAVSAVFANMADTPWFRSETGACYEMHIIKLGKFDFFKKIIYYISCY